MKRPAQRRSSRPEPGCAALDASHRAALTRHETGGLWRRQDPLILHAMEEAQITQLERAVEKAADARDDRMSTRSGNSADGASRRRGGTSDTGTGGKRRPRASMSSFQED